MAKVNITKPTGSVDNLNIMSAFKADNNIYVVLDSEKMGSMGLPIIYVSKYTTKLEKINDSNEWQSVKNYLKGIISGTSFEYVKINDNLTADEAYYTPLTLPQASFDAIKKHYVIKLDNIPGPSEEPAASNTPAIDNSFVAPENNVFPTPSPLPPETNQPTNNYQEISNIPTPAMPSNQAATIPSPSNQPTPTMTTAPTPPSEPEVLNPAPSPVEVNRNTNPALTNFVNPNPPTPANQVMPQVSGENISSNGSSSNLNFESDKETFLKACENMFDALISKYQKELKALEAREARLAQKEAEINIKMNDATEHLKNAAAREQVANIAHDNAQKVMDLNSFMPTNPNNPS